MGTAAAKWICRGDGCWLRLDVRAAVLSSSCKVGWTDGYLSLEKSNKQTQQNTTQKVRTRNPLLMHYVYSFGPVRYFVRCGCRCVERMSVSHGGSDGSEAHANIKEPLFLQQKVIHNPFLPRPLRLGLVGWFGWVIGLIRLVGAFL